MHTTLACGDRILDLTQPQVMGILNVTPDSFSDGGQFFSTDNAVRRGIEMVEQGAAIIDVGGESTRPGAAPVSVDDELTRVIPVITALSQRVSVPISIDTSKPEVMRAAVAAGAGFINDVYALRAPGALEVAAKAEVPVCLMHMLGEPRTMQQNPVYQNVVHEVKEFLAQRVYACERGGIPLKRLVIDPGFGFGKSLEHNLKLFNQLAEFVRMGLPVLVGVSRKSMLGSLLSGQPPEERIYGGVALATLACLSGVSLIRTHDVRATCDALAVCRSVMRASP